MRAFSRAASCICDQMQTRFKGHKVRQPLLTLLALRCMHAVSCPGSARDWAQRRWASPWHARRSDGRVREELAEGELRALLRIPGVFTRRGLVNLPLLGALLTLLAPAGTHCRACKDDCSRQNASQDKLNERKVD